MLRFHKRIILLVRSSVCFWLISFSAQAQLAELGKLFTQQMGSASYSYRIDSLGTGVLCSFSWNNSLMGKAHLRKDSPVASFNFSDKIQSGVCQLKLMLPDSNSELGELISKIRTKTPAQHDSILLYNGLVAAWIPQKNTAAITSTASTGNNVDSVVFQLTPAVTVVTKPIGSARNNASVTIYSGSVLIYVVTLTQASPFVTYNSDVILGDFKINSGMKFTLQIPSKLQLGSMQMQATYSSLNIPPTTINSMIATWSL